MLLGTRLASRQTFFVAATSLASGILIGWDFRLLDSQQARTAVLWLSLAAVVPLPPAAVRALYHDPLHVQLLSWPMSSLLHARLGSLLFALDWLPWLLLSLGTAIGASWSRDLDTALPMVLLATSTQLGGGLIALSAAALGSGLADSDSPLLQRWRQTLAGPFSGERHAPFFYLPAVALGVTAASAAVTHSCLGQTAESLISLGASFITPGLGFCSLLGGIVAYRGSGLRTIARANEQARTIFDGRPPPAGRPYGHSFGRLLPRATQTFFIVVLSQTTRHYRGLWPTVVLANVVIGAYAVNVGRPLAAAVPLALATVSWLASLDGHLGEHFWRLLRSLPCTPAAAWSGAWFARLWTGAHVVLPLAATILLRHGQQTATILVALWFCASAVASAVTINQILLRKRGLANRPMTRVYLFALTLAVGVLSLLFVDWIALLPLCAASLVILILLPHRAGRAASAQTISTGT